MPPASAATLHGVRVITKPYFVKFVIFAAFNESMNLYLVHTFWQQSKVRVRLYLRILPIVYAQSQFFHTTLLFELKFGVFTLE